MRRERREVVGVVVHVVPVADLAGPSVAAPVVRDDAIAVIHEEHHLRVPVVTRKRPTVRENNGLAAAPVLVINFDAVASCDRGHGLPPYEFSLAGLRGSFAAQQLERVIPLVVIEAGKTPEDAQRLNPSKNSDFHRRLLHTSSAILARDFPGGKRRLPARAALSCARCAARKTGKSADSKKFSTVSLS